MNQCYVCGAVHELTLSKARYVCRICKNNIKNAEDRLPRVSTSRGTNLFDAIDGACEVIKKERRRIDYSENINIVDTKE